MRFFILLSLVLFYQNISMAQNVGIGTKTPLARIDVIKPGGDTPTANFRGSQNISHFNFGLTEDTYIRGGKNGSNVILNDLPGLGNVGIGTSTPPFPLSFSGALGDKISIWNDGTATHYGLGVQASLFQIFSKSVTDDIAFGYGSSGSFTENMRIKGNGYVGIGTASPDFKLDVADRMRIRTGAAGSAGLYLNNNANSVSPAFIGMQDDNHVGLWGSYSGWAFTMNTSNGALKVNGSEGADKQVLTSTGTSSSWKTLGSLIQSYYNYPTALSHFDGNVSSTNTPLVLYSLTTTVTVTTKSRLIISAGIFGNNAGCFGCGDRNANFDIRIDGDDVGPGPNYGVAFLVTANGSSGTAVISNFFHDVNSGTHIIEFIVKYGSGDINIYSKYSTIIVLPID